MHPSGYDWQRMLEEQLVLEAVSLKLELSSFSPLSCSSYNAFHRTMPRSSVSGEIAFHAHFNDKYLLLSVPRLRPLSW